MIIARRSPTPQPDPEEASKSENDGDETTAPWAEDGKDAAYAIAKKDDEKRYTLGVLYTPEEIDAHGEFVSTDDLQKAVWDYVRRGDLEIRDMHNTDVVIGELVEAVTWPFPLEVELEFVDGSTQKVELPANTAYVGTVWRPEAWERVKTGDIAGYSLGGKTVRVYDSKGDGELEDMGKDGGDAKQPASVPFADVWAAAWKAGFDHQGEQLGTEPKKQEINVEMPSIHVAPPSVHVEMPEVNVAPPAVKVDSPDVRVDVAPPSVTVGAPPAPDVHVDVRGGKIKRELLRDPETGQPTGSIEEPIDDDKGEDET